MKIRSGPSTRKAGSKVQSDPRKGLPSASSIERYFACNRSYLLERQVPDTERFENEDALSGQRIHIANQTGDLSELESMKEEDLVRLIRQKEEQIFNQWCSDYEITDATLTREERVWLMSKGVLRASAQIDFYAFSEAKQRVLVIDAKSGRKVVTPPVRNQQLRTAVVILAAKYSIGGARVAIVQPLAKHQPQADYSADQINVAWDHLEKLLDAIHNPEAKAVPGTHCEWCEAKHICPEAKSRMLQVSALEGLKWALLPPAEKVRLWDAWKLAKVIGEQIEENIKAELRTNATALPGLTLTKDLQPRVVTDAVGVYGVLQEHFPELKPEELTAEFNKMIEFSLGALQTFYREKRGGTLKQAIAWVDSACKEFLARSTKSGFVKRTDV